MTQQFTPTDITILELSTQIIFLQRRVKALEEYIESIQKNSNLH